jgi:hypothetical protein
MGILSQLHTTQLVPTTEVEVLSSKLRVGQKSPQLCGELLEI